MARKVGSRLSWGVADQAMSSITNFAVNIYIARDLGSVEYGAFSLAYVTYGFVLNASRGLATDPLMVRFSGADLPAWRRAVATCTGTAMLVGLLAGTCVLGASIVLSGAARLAFLALGLTLPALMLQDSWRFAFFALGRGSKAFLNDTVWAAVLLPSLIILRLTGHANVFWFVFAWGASAGAGAAIGPLQARVVPKLSGALAWLSRQRDLGARYMAEGTAYSAAAQLRSYSVGLILGLGALGYLQAASTLMGPLQVLLFGMGLVALPEAARILRNSPRHMPLFCMILSATLTLLALAWGIALMVALPRGLGEVLLKSLWRPFFTMGLCANVGPGVWMHALAAAKRSLRAATITASAYLIGALAGAFTGGTVGSIRGAAIGAWIGVGAYWWQLRKAVQESGSVPSGDGSHPAPDGSHPAGEGLQPAGDGLPPGRQGGKHQGPAPARSGRLSRRG
jgi:O-antigen/teichoic acid export membrane protein